MEEMTIVEYWQPSEGSCLVLLSSSLRYAKGAIKHDVNGDEIVASCYATFNSPIHNLTGYPGSKISSQDKEWEEIGWSNRCKLKAVSTRKTENIPDSPHLRITVETVYEIPAGYTGPQYFKRTIVWQKAQCGKDVLRVEMEYQDGKKDIGEFCYAQRNKQRVLKIVWTCQHGPNKQNISFF